MPVSDEHEVLREQLEYLIEHVTQGVHPWDCDLCGRYLRVRLMLLEMFK